jgi:cysteinyl-tRNA synthetase
MSLSFYNSLSKTHEEFIPKDPNLVTMYLCGPTVYDYVTIGNFRTYLLGDVVHRALRFKKYKIKYIMNLTDVGHLTGDNLGDADTGDDRLEMAAEKEGKSAKEIAGFYIDDFIKSYDKLNLLKPSKFTKATDYIGEQIELVKSLEKGGFTYEISDGIYFDTSKFESYGQLSGLTNANVKEGARVEPNPEKRNPTDFALWKFSPRDKVRWQEWDSPWGRGFPGWHLECSAMSMKELGETIDIHLGGEDLRMVHHQNEIAQSEAITGKQFVNYWLHGAFLQVDGGRMSKSLGNAYTVADIEERGFEPLVLRYFYMTAHYRTKLNFTWDALSASQAALKKLYMMIGDYSAEGGSVDVAYLERFEEFVDDDLNMPKVIALVWDLLKSEVPEASKVVTLLKFDEVLGLDMENYVGFEIPQKVLDLAKIRFEYRKNGIWDKADSLRREIEGLGFVVEDKDKDYKVKRRL